ncbi:hypothetical protein QAD02_005717 [Eretmocerus hayati]|uniref:Uncharacterized protein n=1 Tax=Eretmocerus hayati TaxID=131215 RepID=A0ACC2NT67_9HYME|nr:hypothetical protein QAD02_005717 [Eretmocerus hayati]
MNGALCAVILFIAAQSIDEVNSVAVGAAIGVVSGVMGIIEFLKARDADFLALKQAGAVQTSIEKESSDWQARLNWNFDNINSAIKNMEGRQEFSKSMDSMRKSFTLIHNNFKSILEKRKSLGKERNVSPSLEKAYKLPATKVISEYSYDSPLQSIYDTISDSFKNYSIYQKPLIGQYEDHLNVCVTHVSPLQAVSKLLEHIVWTSSYYYSTIIMSHEILDILDKRNIDEKVGPNIANEISGWYRTTVAALKPGLSKVSREIYACGLPNFSDKKQFYEIQPFKKFFLRKCDGIYSQQQCSSMNETTSCDAHEPGDVCSVSRPCAGKMFDCTDSNDLDICISATSTQRYQYYRQSKVAGTYMGYEKCNTEKLHEISRSKQRAGPKGHISSWRYLCGACKCTCEEGQFWINQQAALADTKNNMVVTGAKFVLKDNIIEIHIQQGKLLPNGIIDVPAGGAKSLPWIGPQKKDLVPISWNEARKILLAEEAGSTYGEVVIGLGLTYGKLRHWREKAIHLKVHTALFDFKKGDVTKSIMAHHVALTIPEKVLDLVDAESPKKPSEISKEKMKNEVQLKFTTSGGKDGGQSTIPYIDAREVTSNVPTPMSGAALHWKGREGTGGIVAAQSKELSVHIILELINQSSRKNKFEGKPVMTFLFNGNLDLLTGGIFLTMVQLNGIVCAVILSILAQTCHEAESFPYAAAIGVVSGVMGIIEFLKARYHDFLSPTKPEMVQNMMERESSDWKARLNWNVENIHGAIKNVEERQQFSKSMDSIRDSFTLIHNNFQSTLEKKKVLDKKSKISASESNYYKERANNLIDDYDVRKHLKSIYDTISDSFKKLISIYPKPLIEQYEDHFNVCVTRMSPLQAVSKLLEQIVWISSEYYNTLMMSQGIIDKLEGRDTFPDFEIQLQNEIAGWYNETVSVIGPGLRKVSRRISACGLPNFSQNGQFYELNAFKKFFVRKCNEINRDIGCSAINETRNCDATQQKDICSVSRKCAGKMFDCTDSNGLDVCVTSSSGGRRYQYYHDSKVTGQFDGYERCEIESLKQVIRYKPNIGVCGAAVRCPYSCDSCKCICEEEKYWINQEIALADTKNNMVVTGAKFVLKNNVLEIHVQQGKLLPNGVIDISLGEDRSLSWVGPQKQDLVPISWDGARRIIVSTELGALYAQAVVGLNLVYEKRRGWREKAIHLKVRTALFEFRQGDVTKPLENQYFKLSFPERELNLTGAESPRISSDISREIADNNATLRFTTSGGKDGGQSTIPFIDAREVTSAIPTPMAGASLYWRGKEGTGGFIGIRLYTYNTVPYITNDHSSTSLVKQNEDRAKEPST